MWVSGVAGEPVGYAQVANAHPVRKERKQGWAPGPLKIEVCQGISKRPSLGSWHAILSSSEIRFDLEDYH